MACEHVFPLASSQSMLPLLFDCLFSEGVFVRAVYGDSRHPPIMYNMSLCMWGLWVSVCEGSSIKTDSNAMCTLHFICCREWQEVGESVPGCALLIVLLHHLFRGVARRRGTCLNVGGPDGLASPIL